MRSVFTAGVGLLGAALVVIGIVLAVRQTGIVAEQTKIVARAAEPGVRGVDLTSAKDVLAQLGSLPPPDRLIVYGILLLAMGGLIGGWLDLSAGASTSP